MNSMWPAWAKIRVVTGLPALLRLSRTATLFRVGTLLSSDPNSHNSGIESFETYVRASTPLAVTVSITVSANSGDPNGAPTVGRWPRWPRYSASADSLLEIGPEIAARTMVKRALYDSLDAVGRSHGQVRPR